MSTARRSGERKHAIAALLVGFQSVMSLIVALALFASAHRASRWLFAAAAHRRLELAWIMIVVTLIAVVIAVALASFAEWGRFAALVFEAFVALGAIMRLAATPVSALVALAIAAAVIWLVASEDAADDNDGAVATSGPGASSAAAP